MAKLTHDFELKMLEKEHEYKQKYEKMMADQKAEIEKKAQNDIKKAQEADDKKL